MAEDSDLEKTEAPTPQKEEKAREEGQIPRSRELTSVVMMVAGLAILWIGGDVMAGRLARIVSQSLNFDYATIGDDTQMLRHVGSLLRQAASALVPIMLGAVLVALSAPMLLGGILFSTKSLKVDFKKLDPISGLKRLFSSQSLAELFKAILKSVMVGIISTLFLIHNWPKILHLVSEAPIAAMGDALELAVMCGFLIIMGLIPMVAFDVFWQVWSHIKKLRMTKQEIRDEHKQSEGDPHVKGRIRQQQRAMAQRRMMADVPKADVIVTNPTHYAVALRYDEKKMNAPKVLAKGAGDVALRIRELGTEHRVPILEAPPLARALFRHSEVGQHIPAALYAAVAEVLAWVYQLKRWKREGGLIPRKPKHLPVPDALDFAKENTTDG
ncbi:MULTISPECIES: flagellar biosynthesis protein FlhB [Pectobacterium]|uniref:Flagellar biosynthetic protein FlhB n=1 Tax=Pectobacterium parvum TaxID=2778550 RepID=A0AAP9LDJ9_9GAMM|nr:flagellar biosynthesis protein FlhB [Pectobacterium parvum]GKW40159.1 flagellar biosynthesis protein FlhB [Pectobacterium carotovorum subsp. carotovorum]KFX12582.1 flagellar biosynthesis protein FlhB [Pectobacterium parvum]MCU1801237.1 flagellar type III secretion system protein FlhB [Pectobacterium parvum]QHQ25290.1 flagellar type III secretion system protein FlhB [Pectobacterium parvum]UVD96147.1 flagellar biosynthesis protein FlhB [Pectobacterium parvum]